VRVGLHSIHATGMPRCAHTLAQIHDLDLRAIFAKYHLFAEERKILRAGGKNRHVLLPAAVLPSQTPLSLSSLFVEAAAPMFLERRQVAKCGDLSSPQPFSVDDEHGFATAE